MSATKIEFDPAAEKIVLDPKVEELPRNYFLGADAVHAGKIFQLRLPTRAPAGERVPRRLGQESGCNLRAFTTKRNLT